MTLRTYFAVAAAVAGMAVGAKADYIGVNFIGANNGGGALVSGPAGLYSQSNWNNEVNSSGSGVSLNSSSGSVSGATMTWSSNNNWATGQAGLNQDGDLMQGYIDNTLTKNTTITVSNIPVGIAGTGSTPYSVIIYIAGDTAGRGGDLTVNGVTETVVDKGPSANGVYVQATAGPSGVGGTQGNYVEFDNVTGTTLSITAVATIGGANARLPIDGFQIVPVPETSHVLLAAVGALAVAGFVRRRFFAAA